MNLWPLARWRKEPVEPQYGITLNDGRPMRLANPFTRIAVYDGAIQLWSDDGAWLMVPRDAKTYLSGIIAESEDNAHYNMEIV